MAEFERHFNEKGWRDPLYMVFYNEKGRGQYNNQLPWFLDEPVQKEDFEALRFYSGIFHSGFSNVLRGPMYGAQISGFSNFTSQNVDGLQASGFSNVAIKDVVETDLAIGASKQKAVRFVFEFTTTFEPKVGNILLGGEVLFLQEAKSIEKVLDDWKKSKKVEKDVMTAVLNNVLAKCNVEALILSQDVNLPSPLPLPKVKAE